MTKTMLEDVAEFTKLKQQHMGGKPRTELDSEWIIQMVKDELKELKDARTEAEKVDALLDAVYYIFDCLNQTGLPIQKIWDLIQAANMSKFTLPGGYLIKDGPRKGKWEKPPGFVSPDNAIAELIRRHRNPAMPLTVESFLEAYPYSDKELYPEQRAFLDFFCNWAATRRKDNELAAATDTVFYSPGQRQGKTTLLQWMQDVWSDRIHVVFDWRQPVTGLRGRYNPTKPQLLVIDAGAWIPSDKRREIVTTFYASQHSIPPEGGVFCT